MSKGLLDPKVDFVFKNIFGSPNHPEILISFLNATLKAKKKIVNVDIKKTDIEKQYIEDKYSNSLERLIEIKNQYSKYQFITESDILNLQFKLREKQNSNQLKLDL